MEIQSDRDPKPIVIDNQQFRAVRCDRCGAKMYPPELLQPHLTRHRLRHRWFTSELRKLQDTFARMRDFH